MSIRDKVFGQNQIIPKVKYGNLEAYAEVEVNGKHFYIAKEVGHWEITDAYPHNVYCSVCHTKYAQTHWKVWEDGSLPRNYCPNCGAYMGERKE